MMLSTRFALLVLGLAAVAAAHYTWVAPVATLTVGQTASIRIGHGHKFPTSEEAINAGQVDLAVLAPSGARVNLNATAGKDSVTASYAVKEAGLHRILFVQDRGVSSRTPKGVKKGGRDLNPDATQAFRTLRTAVAYASTPGAGAAKAKPAQLDYEITGELAGSDWRLQVLKKGSPLAGASVEVFLAGSDKAAAAGTTGADGRVTYKVPTGAKGLAMFFVEGKDAAPSGAQYDSVNYSTALYVTW